MYDRFWDYGDTNNWTQFSVSISADALVQNVYKPPAIVMSTAVTPPNVSAPLVIRWEPEHETDQFHVYMHFTELFANQTRQFNIMRNGELRIPNFSPRYLTVDTLSTKLAISGKEINYSLERTQNSTLPPIINAIEIYKVMELKPETFLGDGKSRNYRIFNPFILHVLYMILTTFHNFFIGIISIIVDAITTIKSVYGVNRDWQGDPCVPLAYLWDALNCSYHENDSPRITTL